MLWIICNCIADVISGKDTVMPVSCDLPGDNNVIPLVQGEDDFLLVFDSTCFLMYRY